MNNKQDLYEALIDSASFLLRKESEAEPCRNYINTRLSKSAQQKYGFGYFPNVNGLDKLINLAGKDALEKHSIIYNKYSNYGSFLTGHFVDHNLIMPFRDVYGDIICILGRSILPQSERDALAIQKYKYTLSANKEFYVYGLDIAKDAILNKNYVICVEGQFDCISCHENGISNVVALGWSTLTKYQLFQLLKYTDNIILLFDNDDAGKNGVNIAKKRFAKYANIKSIKPKNGYKDIDEFLRMSDNVDKCAAINMLNNLI